MKVKITRDFVGFVVDDDLIVEKGAELEVSDEVAAFLLENDIAEKPKPAPKKK